MYSKQTFQVYVLDDLLGALFSNSVLDTMNVLIDDENISTYVFFIFQFIERHLLNEIKTFVRTIDRSCASQ
jgi:hypothetical protein